MAKKNVAISGFGFGLQNRSNGDAVVSGTPEFFVTKDGGTQTAAVNDPPVHNGNGEWIIDIAQAEMNADVVKFTCKETTASNFHLVILTEEKIVSDLNDFDPAADTVANVTDVATTDTVGATGLTAIAAAVWDALTSGLTTVGSIGKLLVDKIPLINAGAITLTASTTSGDLIQLYQGGARTVASGNPIRFNVDGTTTDLTGKTTRLAFQRVKSTGGTDLVEVEGVVNDAGLSSQFVTFDILSTDTAAMELDDDTLAVFLHTGGHAYDWTFSFNESAGNCPTLGDGEASVKPRHTTCP